MRSPRTATTGALLALVALLAAPVTAASAAEPAAVPVRALERPVTPIGDEPPRMVDVDARDFADEAAELPSGLEQALQRDVGVTGAEWLAQAEAAAAAIDVVEALREHVEVQGYRLDGTDLVVSVATSLEAEIVRSVGAIAVVGEARDRVEVSDLELQPATDLRGGMPYRFGGSRCSIGLPGLNTVTDERQALTAGHCGESSTAMREILNATQPNVFVTSSPHGQDIGNPVPNSHLTGDVDGDVAPPSTPSAGDRFYDHGLIAVDEPNWTQKPEVVTWGFSSTGAPLSSEPLVIRDAGPGIEGATACKSGATSGWTCGEILAVDSLFNVGGDYYVAGISARLCMRGGDSGGPAMIGDRAIGINSASTADDTCVSDDVGVFSTLYSDFESVTDLFPNWEPLIDVSTPDVTRNGTDFSGTLDDGTIRHSVDIEFSNGRTLTTPVGSDGTWSIDASTAYIATADYEVTARWGEGSRSDAVLGSISIPTGAITGRITTAGSGGAAIDDARVRFHDTAGVFLSETTTDANGEYAALGLAAGDYLIRVIDPSGEHTSKWFPSASSAASGTAVTVNSGQTTSGIDVSLPDVPIWPPAVSRIAGDDRYRTAAKIAQEYAPFTPGEGVVYVATGQGFADALSAAAAAAYLDAPLLLTAPTSLPSVIRSEIVRLKPHTIIIVGGTSVVSSGVERALKKLAPNVERQAGSDRYTTSRIVSREAFEADGATTAFVATGSGFADALAAASAAGSMGAPVVLVDGSSSRVPSATRTLLADLGVDDVYVAGGTAVVSNGILSTIRGYGFIDSATRLAGSDRYTTSMAITEEIFPGTNGSGYFAVGTGYADALAGAALAGGRGEPLYIVPPNCVPRAVLTHMKSTGVEEVSLLGGTAVLSSRVAALSRC
jgi:putative cell wall-binding protein